MIRIEAGIGTSTASYYGSRRRKKKRGEKHSGEINKDVTIGLFPVCVTCQRASSAAC